MSPFSIFEILSFALKSLIPFLYWRCFERFRTIKIYLRIICTIHYRIKIQYGILKSTSYLSHPLFCPMLAISSEKKSSSSDFFDRTVLALTKTVYCNYHSKCYNFVAYSFYNDHTKTLIVYTNHAVSDYKSLNMLFNRIYTQPIKNETQPKCTLIKLISSFCIVNIESWTMFKKLQPKRRPIAYNLTG